MAQLGDGLGSGYPAALDTSTTEVNDPGGTVISAEKINDVTAAIIAIQTELGLNPAGSLTDLVSRIDLEHNADGTHNINDGKGADISSAATTDIGTSSGKFVDVTGVVTITSLGTSDAGLVRRVRFTGASLILTHNATSLILPGNVSIITLAGDVATFTSLGSGDWICTNYQRDVNTPNDDGWIFSGSIDLTSGSPTSVSLASSLVGVSEIDILVFEFSTGTASQGPLIQIGDSGGLETSGYVGAVTMMFSGSTPQETFNTGFLVVRNTNQDASTVSSFNIRLLHMGSNVWVYQATGFEDTTTIGALIGTGRKTLTGVLDRVTITTDGGVAQFDNGIAFVRTR